MPHSVSPEPAEPQDAVIPDAPAPEENASSSDSESAPGPVKDDSLVGENKENVNVKLDDMFDNDEDDEFSSSNPQSSVPQSLAAKFSDDSVMKAFYQRLFPFRYLFQWLNHSPLPTNDFAHREFAFTLPNDAYLRYQSFTTADMLRKQCVQMLPSRFEIGPIYTTNPRERKTLRKASAFRPINKELVFDIDMTDYDEIRTCCSGANICNRCWSFITMAIKVVDAALRDDFGFKHILWVYSGRRGAHAWVCDKKARELADDKRRAIAGYMEVIKGGDKGGKKVSVRRPLHPHLERSLQILRDHFEADILNAQDPFAEEKHAEHLLNLIPDNALRTALSKKWDASPGRSSSAKWSDIDNLAGSGVSSTLDTKALKEAKQDTVLEYTYPRLDAEVSKKLNHLLKSPFCVHPGTGRVCVPIDVRSVEDFNPLSVPTVTELLDEIDAWDNEHKETIDVDGAKRLDDWEKTRLKGYVDLFRTFVSDLLKDEKLGKRGREEADPMEF